jgi:hypothetical protein
LPGRCLCSKLLALFAQAFLAVDTGNSRLKGCLKIRRKVAPQTSISNVLTKVGLTKLRMKAIRSGVWFRSLPRIDRVLIDLTIRVADNIRSKQLAKSIFAVVGKLEGLLESKIMRLVRTVGRAAAERISEIAQKLGYCAAKAWAADGGFAVYLAVMHTNR